MLIRNYVTRAILPTELSRTLMGPFEAGSYKVRFSATEHKRRVHEVERIKRTFDK
jgi:hypothetical protein